MRKKERKDRSASVIRARIDFPIIILSSWKLLFHFDNEKELSLPKDDEDYEDEIGSFLYCSSSSFSLEKEKEERTITRFHQSLLYLIAGLDTFITKGRLIRKERHLHDGQENSLPFVSGPS